ncbi:hypothetical protein BH10BDE1_BH10BDE1_31670 [soil metagenome]
MSDKRKLTPFLAHEMLFDYATGQLDPDRRTAVEDFVREDKESQNLLDAIRRGIAYTESLKSIELTEEVLVELDQAENLVSLSKRIARWSEWPDSLRWSIIAIGISVGTAALVVLIPWKSMPMFRSGPTFDSGSIEMARVEPRANSGEDPNLASNLPEETKEADSGPLEGSGDEEFSEEASGVASTQRPVSTLTAATTLPKPTPVAIVKSTPIPAAIAAVKPTPVLATPVPVAVVAAKPIPAAVPSSKASRSFVYRAFMTLGDLEDIAPKITQQIKELGAEKAGEVELGWRRGSGRYYHFTIPEANEQKLLENLRVYGPVRISKDPHPRVMPEGQVRFILWIESGT